MTEEEEERIEKEAGANTEKQKKAMGQTFGYDDEPDEEEEEKPTGEEEEQEETEQPEGEEEEEQPESGEEEEESEEEGDDLDDFLADLEEDDTEEEESDEPDEEEEESGEEEEQEDEYEPLDIDLDEEEYEEITSNPEKFSDFIKDVREDAVKQAEKVFEKKLDERSAQIEEQILKNIPEVIDKTHNRTQKVASVRDQFFSTYPQLEEKKGYVKNMTSAVSNEHPDWGAKKVLQEVGKRAKRDLDITEQAQEREQERDNPKFAGAGGRQSPSDSKDGRSKQQKLMDETF